MDFSETNIKMCEKATKIQEEWKPQCGDYCVISHPKDRRVVIISDGNIDLENLNKRQGFNVIFPESYEENCDFKFKDNVFFLPRQDQLQEMVDTQKDIPYGVLLIDVFYSFAKGYYDPIPFGDDSLTWEQLWLTFVMCQKYNKVWNGTDWI